jgi:bis(5'-nucleosyl)-tetraphosphatase (symmetrical)
MAIYAIGDVQGCYESLQRLLEKLQFDTSQDQVWFAGDLVNRGPSSLQVLRLVKSLEESAVVVLGNHDLTLLAIAAGCILPRRKDTVQDILQASDREVLLEWLRHRPLMHYDANLDFVLTHAGLAPQWELDQAMGYAAEVERALRDSSYTCFLKEMYGNEPYRWHDDLQGVARLRFIVNAFTRMRYCHMDGALNFKFKGPLGSQPAHLLPWFQVPSRRVDKANIVFGHWAALGFYHDKGIYAIDSGCVWGARLTAIQVDALNKAVYSVACDDC